MHTIQIFPSYFAIDSIDSIERRSSKAGIIQTYFFFSLYTTKLEMVLEQACTRCFQVEKPSENTRFAPKH